MRITENRMILFSFNFQDEILYDVFTSSLALLLSVPTRPFVTLIGLFVLFS